MNRRTLAMIGAVVFLALVSTCSGRNLRAQIQALQFQKDSLEAVNDTARVVELESLGDSVNAMQRRVVQVELEKDSVDRELQQRPVVRVQGTARVDTLHFVDTVEVAMQTDSSLTYEWVDQDGPFTIEGGAEILRPTFRGSFFAQLSQTDDIPVGVRISCEDRDGVDAASILLTARDPLVLVPGALEQAPEVCNPPRPFISVTPTGVLTIAGVATAIVLLLAR